jgi:CHAT domain-containing protein
MDPPASSASPIEDSYADIVAELLAVDRSDLPDEIARVLTRHQHRTSRALVTALRAAANGLYANNEANGGALLLIVATELESMMDQEEREHPDPEHCSFVTRLLNLFVRAYGTTRTQAARSAVFAELREHPELTGERMSVAIREVARVLGGKTAGAPPSRGRIIATLGVAALARRARRKMRTRLASGLTSLGEALAAYPGLGVRGSIREAAVASCRAGYELLPPDTPPALLAEALNAVGMTLSARERDDREANLREAAESIRAALRLLENAPWLQVPFASTRLNLASVLYQITSGDHRAHQEEALTAVQAALGVLDRPGYRERYREEWARAQMLLGMVLVQRIGGDQPQNLSEAVAALHRARGVWVERHHDDELAATLDALGMAFFAMNEPEARVRAFDMFNLALQTRRRETHPLQWAMTQSNLAFTLLRMAPNLEGEVRTHQLNTAIEALKSAGRIFDEYDLPTWAAFAQMNLGRAYLLASDEAGDHAEPWGIVDRTKKPSENIDRAIGAGLFAETVFTREHRPREWAGTHQMLGMAHLFRAGRGPFGSTDDEERGLAALSEALEVFTPAAFPQVALVTGRLLGFAATERNRWEWAVAGYTRAVEAAEQLRRQAPAEARRDQVIVSAADAYAGLVRALVRTGHPAQALAAAERAKARQLSELLAEENLRPSAAVPEAHVEELGRARAAELSAVRLLTAATVRQEISGASATASPAGARQDPLAEYVEAVEAAQAAVARALAAIQVHDPAFTLAQAESPPPTPDELAALLPDERTALLSLYVADAVYAFVQTRGGVHAELATDEEWNELEQARSAYFAAFTKAPEEVAWWLDERLGAVFNTLGVFQRLLASVPDCVKRLVVVPHRYLHLLPLHALEVDGATLIDRFPRGVVYAPSARLLGLAQGRDRRSFDTLLAVQNPTSGRPLPSAGLEVAMVAEWFARSRVLDGENATKAALTVVPGSPELGPGLAEAHALHFACHGHFEPDNPLDSKLLLAGGEPLTLAEVFALELDRCRLAVLSACGTGRVGVGDTEEYVGLPAGFLYAGSAAVVSSLWSVNDDSTALLCARMHARLREAGDPCAPYAVAEALAFAQRWLRDATLAELEDWLGERRTAELTGRLRRLRDGTETPHAAPAVPVSPDRPDDVRPFSETFYWAPFIATGG